MTIESQADKYQDELDRTNELFEFLQGNPTDETKVSRSHQPKLTPDQAWTVIWYLGNEYWQVPDYIERCDLCGELYHSHCEGDCLDYGRSPHHFCGNCIGGLEYDKKMRRNPDKRIRNDYFAR